MNQLEFLANELFLNLFEYLNDVDLIRGFYGLKFRFNNLLYSHLRNYHFDFRSIYKKDFDFICQQYLPSVIHRIQSLHLSDNDDTPQQFDLFLLSSPSFQQFIHLQSLSLSNIRYIYSINKLITQLPNLIHLNISACFLNYDLTNNIHLVNTIWSLPKLNHCKLENVICYETLLSAPTIVSLSLQHLIINNNSCNLTELVRLFEYTPCLEYLAISIWDLYSTEELCNDLHSLKKFKLSFQGSSHVMMNLLKTMPNLCCLTIQTQRIMFDGYQWEEIIEQYLPKLKRFRFLMQFSLSQEKIDQLLQSFQTNFWISKHRWFVQCHLNPSDENKLISLYTIPYFVDYFVHNNNMKFKSTSPDKLYHHSYDNVHSLLLKEISVSSPLVFSNIRNLHIDLPFNEHFWSIVPTVNQLISLEIERFNNNKACFQLQTLIDQALNLHSLKFKSSYFSPKLFFQLKNRTIQQLDLYECDHWFNKQQCFALINSSFSIKCEVLFIKIKKRSVILQLVKKMNQLRALIFQCEDDKWETDENHLIQWLYQHLPSTCSINRDVNKVDIRIWIR
jgi:hypothetical protein